MVIGRLLVMGRLKKWSGMIKLYKNNDTPTLYYYRDNAAIYWIIPLNNRQLGPNREHNPLIIAHVEKMEECGLYVATFRDVDELIRALESGWGR